MIALLLASILPLSAAIITEILQSNTADYRILNFTELANKYGRKCHEFDVETEDGYILKLFRITGNEHQTPVLYMHGILDSADSCIIRGDISIAKNLAEYGYDVWAANARGNKYSRRHVNLCPVKNKKAFWNFSTHEKGVYDLPAIIDFILHKTRKKKIAAIGISQGTTDFYVMGSKRPEYNNKISVFISLAPVAYLQDISAGLLSLIRLWPVLNAFFKSLGYEEVLRDKSAATELVRFICTQEPLGYDLCERGFAASVAGEDSEELEPEFFKDLLRHFPSGTSRKDFAHYVQIANSNRFAQYDYGGKKNMLVYQSTTPPEYNLTRVTMPIVLLVGRNDGISGIKDAERLMKNLPNVVYYHVMMRKKFNHVDFVVGKHLDVYMTPLLRELLCKFA